MSAGTKPIIVQFQVKTEGQENLKNASLREKVGGIELSAVKNLLEIFAANRNRLLQAYKLNDVMGAGTITLSEWCSTTSEILNLNLPWRTLRPKLVQVNNSGLVLYESTFEGLTLPQNSVTVNLIFF
jgi:serine/threonine-protein phosphatase with EF-hand domain